VKPRDDSVEMKTVRKESTRKGKARLDLEEEKKR
jgi:hypothetical protein